MTVIICDSSVERKTVFPADFGSRGSRCHGVTQQVIEDTYPALCLPAGKLGRNVPSDLTIELDGILARHRQHRDDG